MQFKTNIDKMFDLQYSFFASNNEMSKRFQALGEENIKEVLTRKIEGLNTIEKQILSLYYVDELTIEEVGGVLDIDSIESIGILINTIRKIEYLIIEELKTYEFKVKT
ncbi:Sigma-70, region 4 [Dethiosulfatibacter aminovorans DSM 17477]|uniref:Sigma-70, region 4 n=1 Tax=Dethiosulfatibacter aminovorans DSM 17477 TaxID=1121476 RepID=A0A1M6JMX4_9FIRM|nr:sigma factor-like helix-turn-helix DNA-binding protein [Dethiosulfatibacter aminovorans]SHJ48071.1 Sigma-70, region 4 [Dethiosulfatibacter aminovorans DSM 17477]